MLRRLRHLPGCLLAQGAIVCLVVGGPGWGLAQTADEPSPTMEPPSLIIPEPAYPPGDRPAGPLIAPPPWTPPSPTVPAGPARQPVLPPRPRTAGPVIDLVPFLRLSSEYTDNFSQDRNRDDNLRTALSPGLAMIIESVALRGRLAGTLTGAHDTQDDDLSLFYALDGILVWNPTPRLTLRVTDTLTRTDEPRQADRLELRQGRNTFTVNTFMGEVLYRVSDIETRAFYANSVFIEQGSSASDTTTHSAGGDVRIPFLGDNALTLGYEYLDSSNGTDIQGHRGTGAVTRRISADFALGIAGSYGHRDVSEDDPALSDDRFQIWTAALYLTYALLPRWTITASGGVGHLTSDREGDTTSPIASINIAYAFARGTALLTAERGFSETYGTGENFGVVETQGVSLAFSYPFTAFVAGTVTGFYRENEFTGVAQSTSPGRREETVGATAAVDWRPRPWLVLSLDYGYRKGVGDDDFYENRVRLTVGASF